MNAGKYELPDGNVLHVVPSDEPGSMSLYAFIASKPQFVDPVLDGLLQHTIDGLVETRCNPETGEFQFKLTEAGTRRVEHLIETDPEIADFVKALELGEWPK